MKQKQLRLIESIKHRFRT